MDDFWKWLGALVTGAAIVFLTQWLTHVFQQARHRRESELAYLNDQLKSLYGPLHFLTSQSQAFATMISRVQEAYGLFEDRNYSEEELARTQDASSKTIELANAYE